MPDRLNFWNSRFVFTAARWQNIGIVKAMQTTTG